MGVFGEGGELEKGLKVWRGREGMGDPLPSPSSPVLCPPAMPEAGSELPTPERPLWPEVGACFSTGKPEQRAGLMLRGGLTLFSAPLQGWGGRQPALQPRSPSTKRCSTSRQLTSPSAGYGQGPTLLPSPRG